MAGTKVVLAGVMNAFVYNGSEFILEAKALSDSSITVGISNEEIRGGQGAKLLTRYFHTSSFGLTLNDALFQIDYIAMNVGSAVTLDGATLAEEQVTVNTANTLTVAGNPVDFLGYGTIGWYATPGSDNWERCTFEGQTATGITATVGETLCVKYLNDVKCKQVIINGDFIPSEVTIILQGNLFKASQSGEVGADTSSKVGIAEVVVPRFQLDGAMDLTLNMTGAAQTPLSGQALLTTDGSEGCEAGGYYAKIKEYQFNSVWYENVRAITPTTSDVIEMTTNTTHPLEIYALFNGNVASKRIAPSDLTYTPSGEGGATVDADTGVISAGATTGDTVITVTIKGATGAAANISTQLTVKVS